MTKKTKNDDDFMFGNPLFFMMMMDDEPEYEVYKPQPFLKKVITAIICLLIALVLTNC